MTNKLIPNCDYVYDILYTILDDEVTPLCWSAKDWDLYKDKMRLVTRYRSHQDGRLQKVPEGGIFWVEQVRFDEIIRRLKDPDLLHGEINSGMCIKDLVVKLDASLV